MSVLSAKVFLLLCRSFLSLCKSSSLNVLEMQRLTTRSALVRGKDCVAVFTECEMFQHFIIYFTAQSLKEFSQLLSTMEEERKRLVRNVCVRVCVRVRLCV